jgi:hypothetical protein
MKKFLLYVAILLLLPAGFAAAEDESWLEFGGDYLLRYDYLNATVPAHTEHFFGTEVPHHKLWNDALFTNRYGLNIRANALEDIAIKVRLQMYKIWGHQTSQPVSILAYGSPGMLQPALDQAMGRIPGGGEVWADQAYATWSNILDYPLWFSVGRKPSSHGAPGNIKQNTEKAGSAGTPGMLIDAAFDGVTLGWAPEIDAMPGFFFKWCQGKGMDAGYQTSAIPKDTNFYGLMTTWYDSSNLHIETLVMQAIHLMAAPGDGMFVLDQSWPSNTDVGEVSWWGATFIGKPTDALTLFLAGGQVFFNPSENARPDFKFGMLWHSDYPEQRKRREGSGYWLGGRYDFDSTGTKIGLEYNWGSQYWFPFTASMNDIWVNKIAARGDVYEIYIIQELNDKPVAKRGKAYVRLGYQYMDFEWTGSMNWLERPIRISDLTGDDQIDGPGQGQQWLTPIKRATDLYLTFDVLF